MGPMTIFDKSFIQGLTVDEAVMFDHYYMSNITPIFLMEVLGDLAKAPDGKHKSPQTVVELLATKTPCRGAYPNAFHQQLLRGELQGSPVEMSRRPIVMGGKHVRSSQGLHYIYEESPEVESFNRWQRGEFTNAERLLSAQWRTLVAGLDLRQIADAAKAAKAPLGEVRTLADAKEAATRLIDTGNQWAVLKAVATNAGFGPVTMERIRERWTKADRPNIRSFAPYACHVLEVDIVFELALSISQISADRPSNRVDCFYLYYLPFAELFVSNDRLHQRLAPLFLKDRQKFVRADELKHDLAVLEEKLFQLPVEERAKGLMTLGSSPPQDHVGTTTQLWDHFRSGWRDRRPPPKLSLEKERALIEKLNAADKGLELPPGFGPRPEEEPTTARFTRSIPRRIGRWQLVADSVK